MKFTANAESVLNMAYDYAETQNKREFTINHVERALLSNEIFKKAFLEVLSESDYDTLMINVDDKISEIKEINPSTVKKYKNEEKELPIRESYSYIMFATILSNAVYANGFEEICTSDLFAGLTKLSEFKTESCFYQFFKKISEEEMEKIAALIGNAEFKGETRKIANNSDDLIGSLFGIQQSQNPESLWEEYCEDLVKKAKIYKKPFVGREDITETTIRVLARMNKCNPVHVGEPGVGKTAITYGLAKRILEGNVPDKLKDAKLYSVDVAAMLAGAKFRGEFEERLKGTLNHFKNEENVILFIDEIHTIVGAGSGGTSGMDASNILKPYLVDGNIKFIGATTFDEYGKYIEKDKALARRFQKIEVAEPTIDEAIEIIEGLKEAYEEYHHVVYTKAAIKEAVMLSSKYIHDRYLPDKAIDIIDDTGADFSIHPERGRKIDKKDIEENISKICKVIKTEAKKDDMALIRSLEKNLNKEVFGQKEAIKNIVDSVKLSKSGLGDEDKPIGSFLFVGPSGVGKTEVAKQLAKQLDINFLRFDMSEYQEKHSVAKLVGAPAGYVGYEDGGLLTEAIMRNPHSVVLFDEIEKAHPDIFKTFLQVMDYGTLTDNKGKKADFRNAIIIMTSNAGATVAVSKKAGFNAFSEVKTNVNIDAIDSAVKDTFSPEFRNRLSKIIIFNGIDDLMRDLIVKKELNLFNLKLKKKKINASYTDACINELSKRGITSEYGARQVQRVINEEIKSLFVDAIINQKDLKNVTVDYDGRKFNIKNNIKLVLPLKKSEAV